MPDVFISYSRDDQATARKFAEGFEREGLDVWWDQTLNPGDAYDHVTEKALKEAKAVVVLWSKKSVESRWVRAEATLASRNKTLVPVMIEPCDRPIMFELTHTADLSQWNGDPKDAAWKAYLSGVRRFVQKDVPAAPTPMPLDLPRRSWRLGIWFGAGALAVLTAGVVLWTNNRSAVELAAPVTKAVTLAVLPFADMSTARDQESFSDGLSEEILNQLAQINDLMVTGRTSSFSFKGKNEDLREIAKKLGVANLLEGSIRKDGKQLRITAQLINGTSGAHMWSQTYDRELKDVFAVQEEIAKDVAQALSIKLDVGSMKLAEGGTTNIEAYDRFLRAEALTDLIGERELELSIQLYRQAVTIDPGFARAWYGLYGALELLLVNPNPEETAKLRNEMSEISARAVAMSPDAWWTQTMLAEQYRAEHKWAEDEVAVNRAVASAPPSQISVTTAYVLFLWAVGRVGESADYMQRVHQTNPLSRTDLTFLQLSLDLAGRSAEASAAYEQAKLLFVRNSWGEGELFRIWSREGANPAAIRAQFELASKDRSPDETIMSLVGKFDNAESARAALRRRYEESVKRNEPVPYDIARFADHFGDKDLALDALRRELIDLRGLSLHQPWLPWETGLRTDPRFKDLLRDLGLVDYFRASGKWGDFCKPVGKDDFECR